MTSEPLRQLLWDQLLDADRCSRYWSAMVAKVYKADRTLAVMAFGAASATTLALFSTIFGEAAPKWISVVSLCVSLGGLWMKLARSTTVAAKMLDAASKLHTEYEILWAKIDDLEDTEVQVALEALMRANGELNKEAASAMPEDDEVNGVCQEAMKKSRGLK